MLARPSQSYITSRHRNAIIFALALLPGCATTGDDASAEETRQAITSGDVDAAHQAVVALSGADADIECTGTLFAPALVVTAAHCFAGLVVDHVALADATAIPGRAIAVRAVHGHPAFDLESLNADIGILELATPVTEIAPLALALSAAPAVDDSVLVVGFGLAQSDFSGSDAGSMPERRSGTATVSDVDSTTLQLVPAPAQPCAGDSGGPILAMLKGTPAVVGVTSYGDPKCDHYAVASRVDAFASFIEPWLQTPRAAAAASTGCAVRAPHRAAGSERRSIIGAWVLLLVACAVRSRRRAHVAIKL